MPKYGNLDELLLKLKGTTFIDNDQYCDAVFNLIENFPAEPVRQEAHAKWKDGKCTHCGYYGEPTYDGGNERMPYCAMCGYRMDLDAKGE